MNDNVEVARMLREAGKLLAFQGADPFRAGAYRRGADTIETLPESVRVLLGKEGPEGLMALPNIGSGLAGAITEILETGRWGLLERLRGRADPESLFQSIPGVGPQLAARLHDRLHVDTLEALEVAAHDGSLEKVPGIGPRRAAGIRASLASMLGWRPRRSRSAARPAVKLLLEIDRRYREEAAAEHLPRIAPRRFNPESDAWLPVLHTDAQGWHFTAMFSNTARAHRLDRTRDWVVIYFYDDHHLEGQATVVTERRGELSGKRVVRGRELETASLYARRAEASS